MSKELNDKLFDTLLEQASSLYINDVASEKDEPAPEFEFDDAEQKAAYKSVMKRVGKEEAKPRRTVRRLLLVAAVAAILTALALNASAVRTFVYKTYVNIGDKSLDVTTESITPEDYSQIVNFESRSDILIPGWLPNGFVVKVSEDEPDSLCLKYVNSYDNTDVVFYEYNSSKHSSMTRLIIENNQYKVTNRKIMGMDGKVIEIISEGGVKRYFAEWCSDTAAYSLNSNCSERMFNTILDNLEYLNN